MLAPRRIGKTWLMDRVKEDLEKRGIRAVRLEVAGLKSEEQFLAELQFLETLVEALNAEGGETVILIDEIALFVHELAQSDPDAARRLLYHIRKLWQSCSNVVWFLTGSIGLDEIGRRHDMAGALLGIELFPLEPFTPEQAHSFFAELKSKGVVSQFEFAEGAFKRLTSELGWLSPYHLEERFKLVAPASANASVEDVEAAFDKLLGPHYRLHFAGWDEHIEKNFTSEDAKIMLAVLAIACETAEGEIDATYLTRLTTANPGLNRRKLLNLLTALANDAYLVNCGERWRFRSGLLRRYWIKYVA